LEEALAREVQEEIGVKLTAQSRLIKAQDIIIPDISLHVVRLTYSAYLDNETIDLSEEHQKFKWVTREEALGLNVDRYLREVLEAL
jgi:8-oxo-dGTP pyrophosphatase MutT (NUDIX family)